MCLCDELNSMYKDYWYYKIYLESDNIINQLNSINFRERLGVELFRFLSIISNKKYNKYPNFMEILLNNTDFIKLYKNPKIRYIVINYFKKCEFSNLNFELGTLDAFVMSITNYLFGVDQVITIPYIKDKWWEATYFDELESVYSKPLRPHDIFNKDNYAAFDNRYSESVENFINTYAGSFSDLTSFTLDEIRNDLERAFRWMYSEYLSYRFFYTYLNKNIINLKNIDELHKEQYNENRWVSKYDGDGYGLDLLFIGDYFKTGNNKEIGVEVKKKEVMTEDLTESEIEEKRFDNFKLTFSENQIMRESKDMDYFIFLYSTIRTNDVNNFKSKLLYFDRNMGCLYDVNKTEDLYTIDENNEYKIVPKQKKMMITNNFNY